MRDPEQPLRALATANEVRTERSELKKRIRRGEVGLSQVLRENPEIIHRMTLLELAQLAKGLGPVRAKRLLRRVTTNPNLHLEVLPEERRLLFAEVMEAYTPPIYDGAWSHPTPHPSYPAGQVAA